MFNRAQERYGKKLLAEEIEIIGIDRQSDIHQIELLPAEQGETYSGGTIAFFSKSREDSEYQPILKDGAPYVLTVVAAPNGIRTFDIPIGSLSSLKAIPTGLTGSGTHWRLNLISGRKG